MDPVFSFPSIPYSKQQSYDYILAYETEVGVGREGH